MTNKNNYHIGLDIGTASIGYAVMDDDFNLIRRKGRTFAGVYLFKEGETAKERREFRSSRRRRKRTKRRLKLLREIFEPHVKEIDPTFFKRLDESYVSPYDKNKKRGFKHDFLCLGKKYYKSYPTIFHLRYKLINEKKKFDIRLIFLALNSILKNRGNFLNSTPIDNFQTGKIELKKSFEIIEKAYAQMFPNIEFQVDCKDEKEAEAILLNKSMARSERKKALRRIVSFTDKKIGDEFCKLIVGNKGSISKFLAMEDSVKLEVNLSSEKDNEKLEVLRKDLSSIQANILDEMLKLYAKVSLSRILPDGKSFSEVMVERYDLHRKNLAKYKAFAHCQKKDIRAKLREKYDKYISREYIEEEFIKEVNKILKKLDQKDDSVQEMIKVFSTDNVMPKQRTIENSLIPRQIHQLELREIIERQSKYYPWLLDKDPNNKVSKIEQLFEFRIPYYIGPLITSKTQKATSEAEFAWMKRKPGYDNVEITPWNFEQVVDKIASEEEFIKRLTVKDTYLYGHNVLPAHSFIYERYKVLNELNSVRINGRKIPIELKQQLFEDLFKKYKVVTRKILINELLLLGKVNPEITGLSDPEKFNNGLTSYIDLKNILGDKVERADCQSDLEDIILWSTIFEDKDNFRLKLDEITWLNNRERDQISNIRYTGWGRLSRYLLTEVKGKYGDSILDLMWQTNSNFMEIQSQKVFQQQIYAENMRFLQKQGKGRKSIEKVIDGYNTSPANKKAIKNVIRLVRDLQRQMGGEAPKTIAIEFARGEQKRGSRKDPRITKIQKIYKKISKELTKEYNIAALDEEIKGEKELNDKLYLYFMQLGHDMYTGKKINIDELHNFDIDHIIPQSFVKDDSLDNRVLVHKDTNIRKLDTFLTDPENREILWGKKQVELRVTLKQAGLLSERKLKNMFTNAKQMDKFQKQGFIKRQLVETRQIVKLVAAILNDEYIDKGTDIIEVRANLVSSMRHLKDRKFIKNRLVNDYHHVFDAYLTVITAQYLYRKYPKLRPYFVYGDYKYDEKQLLKVKSFNFLSQLENIGTEEIMDESGEVITTRTHILNNMERLYHSKYLLTVREVRYKEQGKMFNQTIDSKGSIAIKKGRDTIAIKKGRDTRLYGGYKSSKEAFMSIVRVKNSYRFKGIPLRFVKRVQAAKKLGIVNLKEEIANILNGIDGTNLTAKNIIAPRVPMGQLVIDKNDKFRISTSREKHNAKQLILSDESLETLSACSSKENIGLEMDNKIIDVFDEIVNQMDKYFTIFADKKGLNKLNAKRDKFIRLKPTEKVESLKLVLKALHEGGSSVSVLGISEFGRLRNKNGIPLSENAQLVYQSMSGISERRVKITLLDSK